jgi:hypothetical protein
MNKLYCFTTSVLLSDFFAIHIRFIHVMEFCLINYTNNPTTIHRDVLMMTWFMKPTVWHVSCLRKQHLTLLVPTWIFGGDLRFPPSPAPWSGLVARSALPPEATRTARRNHKKRHGENHRHRGHGVVG